MFYYTHSISDNMRDDDYSWDWREERSPHYEVRRVYLFGPREPDIYRPRGDRFTFSQTEIQHLAIAYLVLVACFSIVLSTGLGGIFFGIDINWLIYIAFPVSLIAVGLGFILHEVAHKFTAQHYGCWSEFRYDERGLLWALLLSSIIGIVWAAPGATWISGHVTRRENGIISLAGPATNITIASILLIPITILPFGLITIYLIYSGFIIAFLAVFNLIPISPLDGSKIWRWNPGLYILAMAVGIVLVGYYWFGI